MKPGAHVVYPRKPDLYGPMEVEMVLTDGRLACRVLNSDDHFDFHPHELELVPGSEVGP
jgi:hypothetical protein